MSSATTHYLPHSAVRWVQLCPTEDDLQHSGFYFGIYFGLGQKPHHLPAVSRTSLRETWERSNGRLKLLLPACAPYGSQWTLYMSSHAGVNEIMWSVTCSSFFIFYCFLWTSWGKMKLFSLPFKKILTFSGQAIFLKIHYYCLRNYSCYLIFFGGYKSQFLIVTHISETSMSFWCSDLSTELFTGLAFISHKYPFILWCFMFACLCFWEPVAKPKCPGIKSDGFLQWECKTNTRCCCSWWIQFSSVVCIHVFQACPLMGQTVESRMIT